MTIPSRDQLPQRAWTAMLAALPGCYGCRLPLRNTLAMNDGFCRDCLDRSRGAGDDELGGEA
jgi:hypothetical protein